jgi:hypothetical protein
MKPLLSSDRWPCFATLLLIAGWHLAIRPSDTGYRTDSMYYLAGAQSLVEDGLYALTTHVNRPRIGLYPPGQSCYLAVFWAYPAPPFPGNVPNLQAGMILVLVILAAGLYTFLRHRGASPVTCSILTLTVGLSPLLVYLTYSFFSEPLFAAFAVWLGVVWYGNLPPPAVRHCLIATGLALMFLTRTAAVGFLFPLAALMFIGVLIGSVRIRLVVWTLPVVIAIVLWWAMPKETPEYGGLLQTMVRQPNYPEIVARQAMEYASGIHALNTLAPRFEAFLSATIPRPIVQGLMTVIACVSMILVVWGFLNDPNPRRWPVACALASYQLQLILWPWTLGARAQLPRTRA